MSSSFTFSITTLQRRLTIVGLLTLIYTINISAHSYLEEIYTTLLNEKELWSIPNSSRILLKGRADILAKQSYISQNPDSTTQLNLLAFGGEFDGSYVSDDWGAALKVNNHTVLEDFSRISSLNHSESIESNSILAEVLVRGWLKNSTSGVTFGGELGKVFSPNFSSNPPSDSLENQIDDEIVGGFFLNIEREQLSLSLSYDKYLVTAQKFPYKLLDMGNERSAPLSINGRRLYSKIAYKGDNLSSSLFYKRVALRSTDLVTGVNPLPFESEWITHTLGADIGFYNWKIETIGRIGGGYLNGYDSEEKNSRYLIFEDIYFKSIYGAGSYKLNPFIALKLFGEYFSGEMPDYGYINFYPFSSWTIFKPTKYRFSEANFSSKLFGLEATLSRQWGDINSSLLKIRPTLNKTFSSIHKEKQKIIVLIPVYTEDTTITAVNSLIGFADLELGHSININRVSVAASVTQIVPIFINDLREPKKKLEEEIPDEEPIDGVVIPKNIVTNSTWGGTRFSFLFSFRF
jgi:hypothetical protein